MIALLIKASFVIAIVWLFYKLFLEKESFFAANRIYLLAGLFLAFLLPFVSLPKLVSDQGIISVIIEQTETNPISPREPLPPQTEYGHSESPPEESGVHRETPFKQEASLTDWLGWIYFFGVLVLSLNLLAQTGNLLIKLRKSPDKIPDTDGIIVNTSLVKEPCSFFRYIFINPESFDYDTYEQILSHEKIHVRKFHSLDLLLSELAVIILWFNPLIWVYRKEVEKNLEYQTDDLLLNGETVEKEEYQMNLLKIATYNKPLTITTNYNQSLIKQRILMMSAKKSNPHSYWKYAFMAPLLFCMLLVINKPFSAIAQTGSDISGPEAIDPKNEFMQDLHPDLPAEAHYQEGKHLPNGAGAGAECKALLRAIKEKNLSKVKELLKSADPDCIDHNPEKELVSIGEGQTYMNQGPRTPLVAAAREGDLEAGKLLTEAGADVEFHAQGDETPLMAASANGSLDFVQLLVASGAEVNKTLSGDGTALIVASGEGHAEIVKYLISQGAEVDRMVSTDGTPLINAVRGGHYEVSKILLENGADPYLSTPGDEYAMYYARESKDRNLLELLKKYDKEK